ncbi:MAG: ribokinase [Actinomycetota bacterium]|nr:ribokinase [Actinomycetota bacterium]
MTGCVVVVGSLNVDLVVTVDRMPDPGETVLGTSVQQHAGGKGLNQAVAAARLGADVHMVGALGTDASGEWLRSVVVGEGIDDSALLAVDGPSGTALIEVDGAGANRIVVVPGSNGLLTADDVDRAFAAIDGVGVVLAQGEVPPAAVAAAMRAGRAAGAVTILNPAPPHQYPEEVYADVDYIVPNEHEAAHLTGDPTGTLADATGAARALVDLGVGCAIITRGARGAIWANSSTTGTSGAIPVKTIDTVAAGDAYCGAFASALAQGLGMGEAMRWASGAGALATTIRGAVPSLPRLEDLENLLEPQPR